MAEIAYSTLNGPRMLCRKGIVTGDKLKVTGIGIGIAFGDAV